MGDRQEELPVEPLPVWDHPSLFSSAVLLEGQKRQLKIRMREKGKREQKGVLPSLFLLVALLLFLCQVELFFPFLL